MLGGYRQSRVSGSRQQDRQQASERRHDRGFENHAGEFCHSPPGINAGRKPNPKPS
jgi:hypothetical protein